MCSPKEYLTVQDLSQTQQFIQLDGNITLLSDHDESQLAIPVHISENRKSPLCQPQRSCSLKTVRRNSVILQSLHLPIVMNLNPRSLYNKTDDFYDVIEQYKADVICISESWERENFTLKQLLNLPHHEIIKNVVQRDFRGGKPVIIVNTERFNVKELCPNPITVPIGVECVWALITPKQCSPQSKIKFIAVASFYYRGPKSTKKDELFDHIAESFHLLSAKYGPHIHFLIVGDANRLNLSPILNLSPKMNQEVKVPTRLNPPAILDPIISTMGRWYQSPITKPPVNANPGAGVKSDHQIVLMEPLVSALQIPPRTYRTVVSRPLIHSGFERFANWIENESFSKIFECTDVNEMAEYFQRQMLDHYYDCFPTKSVKVCDEDKPWVGKEVKALHRQMTREFYKNQKSEKWVKLKEKYLLKCASEKEKYYNNIVSDLKSSNPSKWYSKVKRMAGQDLPQSQENCIEELLGFSSKEQAEVIASHYSSISNQYDEVQASDFATYFDPSKKGSEPPPQVEPLKVHQIIQKMNKKAATVPNDVPIKLVQEFSVEIAFPLAHLINSCLAQGVYPDIWKQESVTPVPKVFPPEKLKDLRKISGLLNFSKVADKIIGEMLIEDMSPSRDRAQYGNEKQVSAQHYLIKLLHRIYTETDKVTKSKSTAVLVNMIDWSQAFDRQCHKLGVQSFIDNGVRSSLIPVLVSFFQKRKMQVKWQGETSTPHSLKGGGTQGGLLGILEYLSQTNRNTDFIDVQNKFKFIDDLSFIEILNLIAQGILKYDFKSHVASDISVDHNQFIPSNSLESQSNLNLISQWTRNAKMQINVSKSKYMIVNFSNKYQFNTRLNIDGHSLEQVRSTKLLGVTINDDLSWHENTQDIIKKANKRLMILHNLTAFCLPIEEMLEIYILYIRSVVEYSAVVWHSSLTQEDSLKIERIQKASLRIILQDKYEDYHQALKFVGLPTLEERRTHLSRNFAKNCVKNKKMADMFPLNPNHSNTRAHEKFLVQHASTDRLKYSAIPYMQRLLNSK